MNKITPIILAGGSGTRLWPVSRESMPKQFLMLHGQVSTYQATLQRVADPIRFGKPIVVTNDAYRFHAEEQANDVGLPVDILVEPIVRDSGPAIAAAAVFASQRGDADEAKTVLILAADHIVLDDDLFLDAVSNAIEPVNEGRVIVFGIPPTAPKPDFGYVKPKVKAGVCDVDTFIEKPDPALASQLIDEGAYWNAGYFMARVDVLLNEIELHAPELLQTAIFASSASVSDLGFYRLNEEAFTAAPKISFDHAIMEKTLVATVVPAMFRWSDIGSWDALWQIGEKDTCGNVTPVNTCLIDADDCYAYSDGPVVGLVGTRDLIVAVTHDAVLVADRSRSKDVKGVVAELKSRNASQATEHRLVRRPWGSYDAVDEGDRYKVKHITVHPGASLSLQKHAHRAEHWIVVRGVAEVTVEQKVSRLGENQSIYIPQGAVHRLHNPGLIPLHLIEVQTGSYLGEDDIVRLDDVFGRA